MVNPGTFKGLRKQFLDSQQEIYAAAVKGKHVADTVADIQRRYFKRFPVTLSHTEEPSEDFLAAVDDDAPDPEFGPPELNGLEPEAQTRATRVYEFQLAELKMRKDQIKRRLQYQYNKSQHQKTTFEMGSSDPMAILMSKLTGNSLQRPRQKTAYNLWGPENRHLIDPIFKERVREGNIPFKQQAALRSSIYKELFDALPEDEQKGWVERATQEHQEALQKIESNLKSGPSTSPADLQRIIECLPRFIEPILDLIADHTGWKVSLIAGGPQPVAGGRLHMMSIHSGVTLGTIKMDFGRSERVVYKDVIVPAFGRFLRKCYPVQECREKALEDKMGFIGLEAMELDRVEIHTFDHHEDEQIRGVAPRHKLPPAVNGASASISTGATADNGKGKLPASKVPMTVIAVPPTGTNVSRGPSPLISRPATPVPSMMGEALAVTAPPITEVMPTTAPLIAKDMTATPPVVTEATSKTAFSVAPGIQVPVVPTQDIAAPNISAPDAMCIDTNTVEARGDAIISNPSTSATPASVIPSATTLCAPSAPVHLNRPPPGSAAVPDLQSVAQDTHPESQRKRKRRGTTGATVKPDKKKRRTSNRGSTNSAPNISKSLCIAAPKNAPTWVVNALELFQTADLGDKWVGLIRAWLKFEQNSKFVANGRLGTQYRPSVISDWIQRARPADYHPEIQDFKQYATSFSAWWQSLQPNWRADDVNGDVPRNRDDWEDIRRPGTNGLVSVAAALFFWGQAVQNKRPPVKSAWLNALDDVIYVFDQLA